MDLISVIVPVYKVEAYLDRCVQSIVDQTYRNLEIILVDDGSPDNCPAMCDAWAEKDGRIKVIHKENGGLSDARNAGMAVASGTYICFVDSDDHIHPEYINWLLLACREHQADVAACDFACVYSADEVTENCTYQSAHYTPAQALAALIQGQLFRAVAWNKLFRRTLLEQEIFPVGRYHEDEFFTYRILAKANRLAYVNAPLYCYLQRSGSIMQSVSLRHLDALDAYLERLVYLKDRYPQVYAQDKMQFCISCAMFYREALKQNVFEKSQFKKKIIKCRKQISFDLGEIRRCNVKQLLYIMGTRCCLDLFCKSLNLHTGR